MQPVLGPCALRSAWPNTTGIQGCVSMSDIINFKIEGLAELQHMLEEKLPNEARLAVKIALSAGGGDLKNAAVDGCPVETGGGEDAGFLRDHLKVKTVVRRDGLSGVAIVGATNEVYPGRKGSLGHVSFKTVTGRVVNFLSKHAGQITAARVARFLEFGTSRMAKHPFLTMAFERSREAAKNHVIEKLRELCRSHKS